MLTQIENNKGIISYDNQLMNQIISDAIAPFKSSCKLVDKVFTTELEGVCVTLELHIKFGTSISLLSDYVLNSIADKIENSLELPVKNLKIHITGIYSKKLSKRDIVIEYKPESEITDKRD